MKGHVTLFNRNQAKGKAVADELKVGFGGGLRELSEVRDYDILAHATSAGFHESTECAIEPTNILPGKILFEVVHMPRETALTRLANEKGTQVIYGYKMLLHLAGHIFELFTNEKPPLAAMEAALMKELGK